MAAITDFLKQNPALKDEDPIEVAQYVYETQIKPTGASKAEFDEYFLGAPVKSDSFLGDEYGDYGVTKLAKKGARGIVDAIKGDAARDNLGNLNSAGIGGEGIGGQTRLAGASILGNDNDVENELKRQYPDATFSDDGNGNRVITMADGREAYINQPGLDLEDVTRFGGKALAFVPAGFAGLAAKGGGMLARSALVGGASGATDAALQRLSGREEIDQGQVATTAVLGAGAEAAAPALGRLAKRLFGDKDYIRAGRAVAQERGIENPTREQLRRLGEVEIRAGDQATDAAKAAEGEFGLEIPRSRAMRGGTPELDELKYQQASLEEAVQDSISNSGRELRQQRRGNVSEIEKNLQKISARFGDSNVDNAVDAAGEIKNAVLNRRDEAKAGVNAAYDVVRSKEAWVDDEIILSIPDRIRQALDDSDVIVSDELTKGTKAALRYIDNFADSSIKQLENQRRKFNQLLEATKNDPPDHRAINVIKNEFDNIINDAAERRLMTGDLTVIDDMKNARQLRAEFGERFERADYIKKIVDKDLEPEALANLFVGANGMSNASAAKAAKQYKNIVGEDSPEWQDLRKLAFLRFTQDRNGEFALGAQALSSNITRAMNVKNRSLFNELYTEQELNLFRRFGEAVEATLPLNEGNLRRSSGTAERIMRVVNSSRVAPIIGDVLSAVATNMGERVATRQIVNARPISVAPATGAYSTSQ